MKPDNVMLLGRGRRARRGEGGGLRRGPPDDLGARREDKVSGTPEYVAPERFLGAAYDHRADIYALGVLAYEALTGSVPFRGPSYLATFTMHVQDPPPPLDRSELARAVPAQLCPGDPADAGEGSRAPARPAWRWSRRCCARPRLPAGLRTAWDDLELPAVDEIWRKKLAERMPSPWGRQKKALLAGALALAARRASAAAVYYGFVREPEQVVKYVEVTKTEEAEPVAAWLEKAVAAAREQQLHQARRRTRRWRSSSAPRPSTAACAATTAASRRAPRICAACTPTPCRWWARSWSGPTCATWRR